MVRVVRNTCAQHVYGHLMLHCCPPPSATNISSTTLHFIFGLSILYFRDQKWPLLTCHSSPHPMLRMVNQQGHTITTPPLQVTFLKTPAVDHIKLDLKMSLLCWKVFNHKHLKSHQLIINHNIISITIVLLTQYKELGINFEHIRTKSLSVLNPLKRIDSHIMDDTDLAGPLFFALMMGVFLLLVSLSAFIFLLCLTLSFFFVMQTGKLHFGYIYGMGGLGCVAMYIILNLMCEQGIDVS